MPGHQQQQLQHAVLEMFDHAFNNYMQHGYPRDEVRPLSCGGKNSHGGAAMTLVDTLDALVLLNKPAALIHAVEQLKNVSFDVNRRVHVFELTIRCVWWGEAVKRNAYTSYTLHAPPPQHTGHWVRFSQPMCSSHVRHLMGMFTPVVDTCSQLQRTLLLVCCLHLTQAQVFFCVCVCILCVCCVGGWVGGWGREGEREREEKGVYGFMQFHVHLCIIYPYIPYTPIYHIHLCIIYTTTLIISLYPAHIHHPITMSIPSLRSAIIVDQPGSWTCT